jgi:cytochrome c biogenesis protein CcmG, thiol:disulfide interchange protein DsbE
MEKLLVQRFNLIFIVILLLGVSWIWASATSEETTTGGRIPAPRAGFLAPRFTLQSTTGQNISISELTGRPVLINFWASWCPPCRAEMPAMQRVFEDYQDQGFVILAINTAYQDNPQEALSFLQEHGITFPVLWDLDGNVSRQYQIRALPSTFFLDADGVIHEVILGGPISEGYFRVQIERLLEGSIR